MMMMIARARAVELPHMMGQAQDVIAEQVAGNDAYPKHEKRGTETATRAAPFLQPKSTEVAKS
jgi:hypothetical protein